jgi:hypothetical protein
MYGPTKDMMVYYFVTGGCLIVLFFIARRLHASWRVDAGRERQLDRIENVITTGLQYGGDIDIATAVSILREEANRMDALETGTTSMSAIRNMGKCD